MESVPNILRGTCPLPACQSPLPLSASLNTSYSSNPTVLLPARLSLSLSLLVLCLEMEETSESPANVFGDRSSVSLSDFLTDSDDEGELSIREEMIEKLMQELYKEISHSKSPPVTIMSPTAAKHPIPSSSVQLVVDSGKSETCGESLSGTASTMMAGVEFVGPAGWKEGKMGLGFEEASDEWLTRMLSWGPLEMEDWT